MDSERLFSRFYSRHGLRYYSPATGPIWLQCLQQLSMIIDPYLPADYGTKALSWSFTSI